LRLHRRASAHSHCTLCDGHRTRLPLTFQAFCDDSGAKGTGRWMVLAALFGEAQAFAALAEDWDRWLRFKHPGSISYFKMDEAVGLHGEFQHWREGHRDEKVQQLARLLDRHTLTNIAAIIDLPAFDRVSGEVNVGGRHPFNQPYMLGFGQVLMGAAAEAIEHGVSSPIEVVFDDHDVFRPVYQRLYPQMRDHMDSPRHKAVLPLQPWFRDDQEFVVLQAADMLAGQMRMAAEKKAPSWVVSLCPRLRVSRFSRIFDEPGLRGLVADLHRSADKQDVHLAD
jgi:hypothetical protein